MYDSTETSQVIEKGERRWLLFIHHIPPKPDYFRVKVRRRLHRIGAVALKNSVYLLPHTDEAVEDFQWLRRIVEEEGGDAMLCAASFISGVNDREVESMFRAQSDAEYGAIIEAAVDMRGTATATDLRRLKGRLEQAVSREYFFAERARDADQAVREIEGEVTGPSTPAPAPDRRKDGAGSVPTGATWVTRTGVKVDRIASAWLIRRFIDEQAVFKFVPTTGYRPASGELRFDMFEGEFTHEGDRCTFEVLAGRFAPDDAALAAIGEIIHDIDCKDEKFGRDEVAGVASLIRGIVASVADDATRVARGGELLAGLYAEFEQRIR